LFIFSDSSLFVIKHRKEAFRQVFRDHWEIYKEEYSTRDIEDESVQKMLSCGEGANGYAEYICTHCGEGRKIVPFTCKSRFCPSCGKRYTDEWVRRVKGAILDLTHRHIVFTIPEELREIICADRNLLKEMVDAAATVCKEIMRQWRNIKGITTGILIVIHTFGRDLKFNPHIHMLLTEGGFTKEKAWVNIPYISYKALRKKWQYHLLTRLKESLPRTYENSRLIDYLFREKENGFYVYARDRVKGLRHIIAYIARYMSRPAIALSRIISYNGQEVIFYYEDQDTGEDQICTLPALEFINLLVSHIPEKNFKMVRRFGLYARKTRDFSKR